jgi:putative NIF3 family GTP cyclohydrolase 1 type 2
MVAEDRVEVLLPAYLQNQVVAALLAAHPYEEVAYDLIRLENQHGQVGAGMIGELPEAMSESQFIEHLKQSMQLSVVKHTAFLDKKMKRVAVCGGAGSFLTSAAIRQSADVFITADLKYHEFFEAENRLIMVDIGHYESEVFTKDIFYDIIIKSFTNFAVLLSKVSTNPVRFS